MKNRNLLLAVLGLQLINVSQSLGSLNGYTYIPLTNPRFTDGIHGGTYEPPAVAIDGKTDTITGAKYTMVSSTVYNEFYVDLVTPRRVDKIKTYPAGDCCYNRHSFFNIFLVDEAGQNWQCTTDQNLSSSFIPYYFGSGVLWDCPVNQPGQEKIVMVKIYAGGGLIALTEIEAFGLPFTTFYQPENLILRNYGPDLLYQFINQSMVLSNDANEITNKILSHGCWCAKLDKNNPYLEFLGGPDPVDELDEICKNWFKCRNCNDRLNGGSCNVLGVNSNELLKARSYTLEQDPAENFIDTIQCAVDSESADACSDETCSIDILYLKDIYNYLEENFDSQSQDFNPLMVTDNSTCSAAINTDTTRICTGTAPYLTPATNAYCCTSDQCILDSDATSKIHEPYRPPLNETLYQYQPCKEYFNDCNFLTVEEATAIVESYGLNVGGDGYAFAGSWSIKGIYFYPFHPIYGGNAYYGIGGDVYDQQDTNIANAGRPYGEQYRLPVYTSLGRACKTCNEGAFLYAGNCFRLRN